MVILKSDVSIFLSYSTTSKAYRVFNKRTLVVEESMDVVFDEFNAFSKEKSIKEDDIVGLEENMDDLKINDDLQTQQKKDKDLVEGHANNGNNSNLSKYLHFSHAHLKDQILGDPLVGVKTRASL